MAMTVRRRGGAGAVCLVAALVPAACSSSAKPPSGAPSPSSSGPSGPPLVIGASMSLSGDFANLADPAKKGYELWAATVNATGGLLGRKVTLKIVDDASNPTQEVTTYQNLITAAHVNQVYAPLSHRRTGH